MSKLIPDNECLLVELTDSYQHIATPDKQYSTKTSGIVMGISNEDQRYLVGKKVFFEEYKDGTQVIADDKNYAFIKYEDVRGYEQNK